MRGQLHRGQSSWVASLFPLDGGRVGVHLTSVVVTTSSPNVIDVRNPRTGQADYRFSLPDAAEIDAECARLRKNQVAWSAQSVDERVAAMLRFADALGVHRDAIVKALAADTGRWVLS